MRVVPGVLVVALAACERPCPDFDEMRVSDPERLVSDRKIARLWDAIDAFARDSGRDGVCVPEIRVVADLGVVHGIFEEPHRPIVVAAQANGYERLAIHEMCHALDAVEGISERRPDLFTLDDVDRSTAYPTERLRRFESYARVCEDGPQEVAVLGVLDDECGADLLHDAHPWVREVVWSAVDPEPLSSRRVGVSVARMRLQGISSEISVDEVVGTDDAILLLTGYHREHVPGEVPGVSVSTTEMAEDVGGRWLLRIDPEAGEVVRRARISPGLAEGGRWSLLASDDGHPLLLRTGERTFAWRVDPATLALERADFPQLFESVGVTGTVVDGVAYFSERRRNRGVVQSFSLHDPQGDVTEVGRLDVEPGPRSIGGAGEDTGLALDVVEHYDTGEVIGWLRPGAQPETLVGLSISGFVSFDLETGRGVDLSLPRTWWPRSFLVLPDGRLLMGYAVWSYQAQREVGGLLVVDDGEWLLPQDPCGAGHTADRFTLLDVGGQPWVLERGTDVDRLDLDQLYLSRVAVDPR